MAPVKVFGMAMSGNVARVLVCLEEVGVEYELVNMDFGAGEHKNPEHLARNVSVVALLCLSVWVENGRNFSCPDPSVFLYLTRPFPYYRKNPKMGWVTGRKISESGKKRGWCFSACIFEIPYLVGIFPDLFRISA
jgi:hypothetical protein